MRIRHIALYSVITLLLGCGESDYEQQLQANEKKIQAIARQDWKSGIPIDSIANAKIYCSQNPGIQDCNIIDNQFFEISSALTSCLSDQRTTLCKKTIRILSQSKILPLLPKTNAVELPINPFYWKLPNAMLDSLSHQENYRTEVTLLWWRKWKNFMIVIGALFLTITAIWAWLSHDTKSKAALATLAAEKRAKQIAKERIRRQVLEAARIEAEQQERLELEAAEAEQERIQAELFEKQQAALAAAKLIAEQNEAALILEIAFKIETPKRRKNNVSSSQ